MGKEWLSFRDHYWRPLTVYKMHCTIEELCRKVVIGLQDHINAKKMDLERTAQFLNPPSQSLCAQIVKYKGYAAALKRALDHIGKLTHLNAIETLLGRRMANPKVVATLDGETNLLGAENGVLDLTTFQLHNGTPDDKVATSVGYAFDASDNAVYQQVLGFIAKMYPVKAECEVAQRWFGYCLWGQHTQKKVCFLTDRRGGSNGKTTMVQAVLCALGDYAIKGNKELVLKNDKNFGDINGHSSGMEPYRGKRLIVFEEFANNRALDEARLKELNGGFEHTERYRMAHASVFVEYKWQAKMVFCFNKNQCPRMDVEDKATTNRLMVIPHRSKFDPAHETDDFETLSFMVDHDINSKLRGPWRSYILRWCMEGLERFHQVRFNKLPKGCQEWTAALSDSQDHILVAVDEGFVYTGATTTWVKQLTVWTYYQQYCIQRRLTIPGQQIFYDKLRERMTGFKLKYGSQQGDKDLREKNVYVGWEVRRDE
ncbi:hypothetical protein HK102_003110 [Quaeritorhiza haematococci]|nr:hypothetical protein HK102_003110 [Quaeritorhiza haematococci]